MRTVSIEEARSDLARLVERAAGGEAFMIADGGMPLAKVAPLEERPPPGAPASRRIGFMAGRIAVPDDFDRMGEVSVADFFDGR